MQIEIWDFLYVAFHCSPWERCFFEWEPYKRCVLCFSCCDHLLLIKI